MPENRISSDGHLTTQLDELDSLLARQETNPGPGAGFRQFKSPAIPVLDDLVLDETGEYDDPDFGDQGMEEIRPYLSKLADRLEHKLSMELDEIVNILKGNLKESIMAELTTQLHEQAEQQDNEK